MAPLPLAIAAELANGARDVLRQGAAVLTGNQGSYIKSGEPESIYGKLQQATARQACRRYADDPGQFTGRFAVAAEGACRPYLDDIGYGTPPSIGVPYRGGNCSGGVVANYQVRSRVSSQFNCGTFGEWTNVTGLLPASTQPQAPISGITPIREFGSFPGNTNASVSFQVTAANGTYFLNLGGSTGALYFTTCGESYEYRNLTFTPVTGDIGDCPPVTPDITDPVAPTVPGPRVEPFNPSPDINVDIDVTVNPDLTFDIDFGTGPITIDPFGDPPPDGGGGDGGPAPGDDGEPGGGGTAGPGGDAEGEAPPGSVLVGLQMNMTTIPDFPNVYAEGVYRGAAYIYMGNANGLDQDFAGSMLTDGQFVYAEKDNLTKWRVSANNGFVFNVVPYYREVEA